MSTKPQVTTQLAKQLMAHLKILSQGSHAIHTLQEGRVMLVQRPYFCLQVLHGELAPVPDPPCRFPASFTLPRGTWQRHGICCVNGNFIRTE